MKIIASILFIYFVMATLILLFLLFSGTKWIIPNQETGELEEYDQLYWIDLIIFCLLWVYTVPPILRNTIRRWKGFEDDE